MKTWRRRSSQWVPRKPAEVCPFFADAQLRGPYLLWHHTHTFTPCDGGTVLGDEVVMRPKGGPLAGLLMNLFVRRDVQRIFEHRAQVTAERFGGKRAQHDVRWLAVAPATESVGAR